MTYERNQGINKFSTQLITIIIFLSKFQMESTKTKFYFTYSKVFILVNNQKIQTIADESMKIAQMTLAQFRDKYLKEVSLKIALHFRGQQGEISVEGEQQKLIESVMIMANGAQGGQALQSMACSDKTNVVKEASVSIKLSTEIYELPVAYGSRKEYANAMRKFYEAQILVEGLQEKTFFKAQFKFVAGQQKHITKRIVLSLDQHQLQNFQQHQMVQLKLYYKDSTGFYEGHGLVNKVFFVGWGKLDVLIDINIQSPVELSKEQPLPESVQSLYTGEAEFAILDYTLNLPKIDTILTNYCQKAKDQSTEFVRDIIFSTKVKKGINADIPSEVTVEGLPKLLNESQRKAVLLAQQNRVTLIQGPSGVGKTVVVATIVSNWMKDTFNTPRIIICAPSNTAADLIAERLQSIPMLSNQFIRFYSEKRENLFNIDETNIMPNTLLYRMLFKMNAEEQSEAAMKIKIQDKRLHEIKYYVEYYFSDFNFQKDKHLHSLIAEMNNDNYLSIYDILEFNQLRRLKATLADIKRIAPFALNFELNESGALIRKKERNLNESIRLLGFDNEGIRNLNADQYKRFMLEKAKQEKLILKEVPIIVTTCHCYMNSRLSELKFKKVIVDEAAQASEIEILIAAKNAEQLVLVGDHKQLGPIYKLEVPKCDSMFSRFMEAGYPIKTMLNECYRLHPQILAIPNNLFYDGQIISSYTHAYATEFISRDKPMLFIHSESPEERYGVSFTNEGECEQVVDLLKFIEQSKLRIKLKDIGLVSPYAGQTNKLRQHVEQFGIGENVKSIDSWQGRETEVMIMSAVRSNTKGNVGFIDNERRINVALTRAKHGMIIIGNSKTLKFDKRWELLLKVFKTLDCFAQDLKHAKEMIMDRIGVAEMLKPHIEQQFIGHSAGPKVGGAGCSEGSQSTKRDEESDEEDEQKTSAFNAEEDFM
ncbi:hypothetical protein FGO68_gene3258 [Halteria grandinella]|uniref:HTH La-type RNA-binding domain-containing protein n=1 Tax=Halteria grandinella TaxID=5974 RepID=A0A8J8T6B0_HALGN|nr:hypothetical protein FGO68_gene3258 [Halteria grandinella]